MEELDGVLYEAESPTGLTFSYEAESAGNPALFNIYIFLDNIRKETILYLTLVIPFA